MNPTKRILRAAGALLASNAAAKIVGAITLPVITRLYSPADFGEYSLFVSVSQLLLPFATLKYAAAIAVASRQNAAVALTDLSIFVSSMFSVVVAVGGGLVYLIGPRFGVEISWTWPAALAAMVLATGLYEAGSGVVTRTREFGVLAKTKVSQSILGGGAKIILGLLGMTTTGLLIGQVISQGGGATRLLSRDDRWASGSKSAAHLISVARAFADFPKFRVASQFLLALSVGAPLFYARFFFTTAEVGQLGLALTIVAMPSALIGQSLANVLVGEISHELRSGNSDSVRSSIKAVFIRLVPLACLAALGLMVLGRDIFVLFFGKRWGLAGELAQLLAVCMAFQVISTTAISLLSIKKSQIRFFVVNLVRLGFVFAAFAAGATLTLGIQSFVVAYAVALCLYYVFATWYSIRTFKY